MPDVVLGDVSFDPVETQDFRLSVEGTSGVGKSNTLSVILEALADVAIPTLIVERVGALSPVRTEDEDIVVVGAREEEGIDLAVALDDLDMIGSWVLDRGMKILLDISTYADYEEDRSRVHLAAARAIRSLNDRAHEKYRSGSRTKSLLVADEGHYLAPKNGAPEPPIDEWVVACRGQLIKAATEGGNKGISTIVAYQRRAFLHNGVIQLCDDFIAHRPGQEDVERTAKAFRCDEDLLAGLGPGEIVARGDAITDGDLVGPTTVRKRRSPDPREETFELPETPDELADVLDEIQSEVEAEREKREERQSEIEELREENERLSERVEELREELNDSERIARALEHIQEGGSGEASAELAQEIEELEAKRDELSAKVDRLSDENEELHETVREKNAEIERLEQRYDDDMAALNSLRTGFQMLGLGDGETVVVEGVSESDVERIVEDRLDDVADGVCSGGAASVEDVYDAVLSDFRKDAADRIVEEIEDLDDRQKRLLAYLEARGKSVGSRKQWAQQALGLKGKPNQTHYDAMNDLVEAGYADTNAANNVKPTLREKIEDELSGYDTDESAIDDVHQDVIARVSP